MKILVTGSSGHLGEAIMRLGSVLGHQMTGLDIKPSPFTDITGSIKDKEFVGQALSEVDAVIHSATLHKPHIATHSYQDFIDTNVNGTLNLLEAAVKEQVKAFVFTSTTSAFGQSLNAQPGEPAAWINEEVPSIPKNIYGTTKLAAEDLCELFHYQHALPCLVLRTSRFFPEEDDNQQKRQAFSADNLKANEFLHRRVDLEDAAKAHFLALEKAAEIGFTKYIISSTSPFRKEHLSDLHKDAGAVVEKLYPEFSEIYQKNHWKMSPRIDRVYVNEKARKELDWQPNYDFAWVLEHIKNGTDFNSELARNVGIKGYHPRKFQEGPYPVKE
ncbi:MAG: NAD(P)-dependent oxidoreductase [Cyclobacteriaceae bacterium]|nr:NAD(P)-dependent oxidoreductase [Cyclobacteriaceae bacterium]